MMKHITHHLSWKAILSGFLAKVLVSTAFAGFFSFFLKRFMLMLGTPAPYLMERYQNSPVGFTCGAVAAIAGYFAFGYVIAKILKSKDIFAVLISITAYIIIEVLFYLLAVGLHVSMYNYVRFSMSEIIVHILCVVAAYVGGFIINKD